ncbi:GNAT family N-acetyltransferase [Actinoplanes sp. NPDC023936]|uniref:GNAT family N-acetyltransferase n=1 Tax=Actinoplanes sp. NPDC023936 TaxID=3154910 RepID=UPI003403AB52
MTLRIRVATREDLPALRDVMAQAIAELQRGFLDETQIAASHEIMGLDTQLVDDGTYFVVESVAGDRDPRSPRATVCGCGGWSRRATLYGGDHTAGRDGALLDPTRDPAKVRAMYTHPGYARRGIGRMILAECEKAAAAEGFTRLELMGTLSGQPLYAAAGFEVIETLEDDRGGVPVPLVRMGKALTS